MIIEFLNIGLPKKEKFHRKTITTGIGKRPVLGSHYLRKSGFDGDGVADSGSTGFYLRVLEEGVVEAATPLIPKEKDMGGVTIAFANNIFHHNRKNCDGIETILAVSALSGSWKRSLQELRQKCD